MEFLLHIIYYVRHENTEMDLALYPENSCPPSYKGDRPMQTSQYGNVIEKSTKHA